MLILHKLWYLTRMYRKGIAFRFSYILFPLSWHLVWTMRRRQTVFWQIFTSPNPLFNLLSIITFCEAATKLEAVRKKIFHTSWGDIKAKMKDDDNGSHRNDSIFVNVVSSSSTNIALPHGGASVLFTHYPSDTESCKHKISNVPIN